ncbi:hypothetical protein LJC22_00890 [Desulfosarcina sp. OttesenSCG-928-G10]|nr:hypothetical protein [Desulfosarcina sp. OttesenSCG-928-G10]
MAPWPGSTDPESTEPGARITPGISLRGTVMVLVVLALMVSELQFNWVEMALGRYLATTNAFRPESGNIWEQGRLRQTATQTLDKITTDQLEAQREARDAVSLSQLVEKMTDSRGIMISAERFRQLYSQAPEAATWTLFSPMYMLRLSAEKSWERVYLERENGKVGIYLLDHGNTVLSHTTVHAEHLELAGGGMRVTGGVLSDYPEFAGRIYPAARFFMVLDTLPPETQRSVFPWPGSVLAMEGSPVRVGISDEVNGAAIRIAVEMETPEGRQVVETAGQEWAVLQLRSLLEPGLTRTVRTLGSALTPLDEVN